MTRKVLAVPVPSGGFIVMQHMQLLKSYTETPFCRDKLGSSVGLGIAWKWDRVPVPCWLFALEIE